MGSLKRAWQEFVEDWRPEFSEGTRWIAALAAGATAVAAIYATYVYLQLATVRPLLVFITVDGKPPPICGFCVLFGN